MKLSDHQIKLVRDEVHNNDLTIETLKDDLIDHLCCVTEAKTDNGKTFEEALHEALRELAPDGLLEIETETIML